MDAFYASVEQNDNPQLKGKPVVVGSPSDRGVIAAASYEARKFGIRSAMPSVVAKRLCPNLVFVSHHMKRYSEVSSKIFQIFSDYTHLVEALSIDEAFLDMTDYTGSLPDSLDAAERIRASVKSATGLTCSAGVSYNKFLAKLASGMKKPDGIMLIDKDAADILLPGLPVEKFYGIGKVTAGKLHLHGIHTGADLRNASMDYLERNFGKAGRFYFDISHGLDSREVNPGRPRKSVGTEITFDKDLTTVFEVIVELYKIEQDLWGRVQKYGKTGRTVTLKVKFDDFNQVTKSTTCLSAVTDFKTLHEIVTSLRGSTDFHRKKVRLMGVTLSNLDDGSGCAEQLDLWSELK
jgi:DNA polymerase IV